MAKVNNINFKYIDNGELKYQLADLHDGTFGIRFILIVDEEDVSNAENGSVYISVPDQGNSGIITINKAYRSVIASGKTVTAGEGKVFLLGKFMDIPEDLLDGIVAHFKLGDITYERTVSYSM